MIDAPHLPDPTGPEFSDDAWATVLAAVDRTYADLIGQHEQLERQSEGLHELRRFIASLMGSVSDILAVIDRQGRIEEASASLAALTGRNADLAGAALGTLFEAADARRIEEAVAQLRIAKAPARFEARVLTADGTEPLEVVISPRVNDGGRLVGAVLVGRPVGELRQAYSALERSHRQLQDAQAQLVRNEKLASLGRLLAGVAHELNNPISFVYANAHALERYLGRFETYFERVQAGAPRDELVSLRSELNLDRSLKNLREAIQGARDGAERVRDIVADLRRLSADGSGDRVAFDLVETARIAASWVERGSKSGIRVGFAGLAHLDVLGAPGQIQQIVMNLVQNAMDALKDTPEPLVTVEVSADGGRALLSVRDNGPGVDEANRGAIFDPFFTTKPVGQGTGLGLSISHKIAEEHGGRLYLGPGPGGDFRLDLPLEAR